MSYVSITVGIAVNEKAQGHDLACFKAAMSRFAHQVCYLQPLLIFAILNDPQSHFFFLPQMFSNPGHVHFKILFYLKATLYNPQNDLIS